MHCFACAQYVELAVTSLAWKAKLWLVHPFCDRLWLSATQMKREHCKMPRLAASCAANDGYLTRQQLVLKYPHTYEACPQWTTIKTDW